MNWNQIKKMSICALVPNLLSFFQQAECILPVEAAESSAASLDTTVDWKTFDSAKFKGSKDQLIPASGGKYKSTPIFPINPGKNGIITVPVNGEEYPVGVFAHEGTRLSVCKKDKTCIPVMAPPAGSMVRVNRGIGVPSCTIYGTTDYTPINYGSFKLSKLLSGHSVYLYGDPKNKGSVNKFFWDLNRMFFSSATGMPRLIYLNPGESVCIFNYDHSSAKLVKAPDAYVSGWKVAAMTTKDPWNKASIIEIRLKPSNPIQPGKISGTDDGITVFEGLSIPAPKSSGVTLDNMSSGKIKVVLFTAWWCSWCDKYDPMFKQVMLDPKHSETCDFQIVEDEYSPKAQSSLLQKKYGVTGFPTTIITDAKGNVLEKMGGYYGENSVYYLNSYIEEALRKVAN